jgi:hypothetical protein
MVATLSLDTITSSGSNITVDATKTFTVNGNLLSAGSTNILYKTIDHPIVEADVSGKSELIVTTTPATPRDITLPLVSVTGADTCIITVVVSLDATGTNSVRVMNGVSEAWTGYQKGDFVKFCVSNGAWLVVDHKETMFSARYLTTNQTLAASSTEKITGFTNVTDIGGVWDNTNNKLVSPFAGFWDISWLLGGGSSSTDQWMSNIPVLYINGALRFTCNISTNSASGFNSGQSTMQMRVKTAASVDIEFYVQNVNNSTYGATVQAGATLTQFTSEFNRTY